MNAKDKKKVLKVLSYIGKILVGVLIVSPIILGFFMSFMSPAELAATPPHIIPRDPVVYTYQTAVKSVPIFKFMINSFIVCGIVIVGQILTCSLAAFGFSFYEFKGKKWIFMVILMTMMIPADSIIISNFITISTGLNLKNTYLGLVAPYLTSAMGIFLMRQFYLTIPKALHEAATLDGCKDLRFLFSIVVPMSIPAISSLGVYIFIQIYNQFLWPLLVTDQDRMRTVQIGMSFLKDAEAVDYGIVLAGAVLVLIPAVVVFIVGQKYLVKGMTAGAVKG